MKKDIHVRGTRVPEIITPQERVRILDWATANLWITEGPLVGGAKQPIRWSPDSYPLQRTWADSLDDPRWSRRVWMCSPQAAGKTQAVAIPVLLHAIEHRSTSAMYIASNADLGNTQWKAKILPAMEASPALKKLIPEERDEGGNRLQRLFTNGTSLHIGGSESVGNLSGKTSPVVVCDDVQAYGTLPGFGHPADYAATRTGSFAAEDVTLIYIGTAGTVEDWLYRALSASAYYLPFVPCLGCGTFQLVEFDRFQFDHDDVDAAMADTWMRCANADCDHRITFAELPEMLVRHVWVSTPADADWVMSPMAGGTWVDLADQAVYPETGRNTNVAGFWASAFYWPFGQTWNQRAAEWIGRRGDPDRMKDWQQNIENRPWKEPEIDEERLTEAEITEHGRDTGYAARTIPADADLVLCTVDVQSGYVYFVVRAWNRTTGSSWLVDMGTFGRPIKGESEQTNEQRRRVMITQALDELDAFCREGWDIVGPGGEVVGNREIDAGAIDIGYEPDIVASWWRAKHRGRWMMIRGAKAGTKGSLWPLKPSLNKRQMPYREIDVNQAKHLVRALQRIAAGQPGYQAMPSTGIHVNTLRAYARHMTSERFNRTRDNPRWETVQKGTRNHLWDVEVYNVCLAVGRGVKVRGLESSAALVRNGSVIADRPRLTMPDGRPFLLTER